MYLSKSKYCRGITCPKMLWMDEYMPDKGIEINNESVFENGNIVGNTAKKIFGDNIDIEYNSDLKQMVLNTKEVIDNNKNAIITEASFCYQNNFCSVDILVKNDNTYEIYEVKSSTKVKDIYLEDASYQTYILKKLGMDVKKVCIVYINSFYERHGDLNLKSLFNIEDVTDNAFSKLSDIDNNIKSLEKIIDNKNEPNFEISRNCIKPYECPYFDYCTRNLDKPNIFSIKRLRSASKFKLYNDGIIAINDLKNEKIDDKARVEIDYINSNKELINELQIKKFLETLSYPLYYLDFETFQEPIPSFNNERPYEQIPFQYSLHYQKEKGGKLEHTEFLAEKPGDTRRELAEKLCRDIPLNACTVAYNMNFEKTVIKRLANLFPDLSSHLMNIHDNVHDLMVPFYNMDYYNTKMAGSYSIKYVLPALFPNDKELDYHNLEDVHNGAEAMNAYFLLFNLPEEEAKKLRSNMLAYCGLDTYAMVKILDKLQNVCD